MTGLTAPYEEPENPELIVATDLMPLNDCVDQLIDFLIVSKIIFSRSPNGSLSSSQIFEIIGRYSTDNHILEPHNP